MLTLFSYPDLYGVADNNPYGLKVYAFLKLKSAYKARSRFLINPAPWWKFMTCRHFKTALPAAAWSTRRCSLRLSLRAQAAEVEVSLQMREPPEQLLKRLSSGIHRRRLYKRRHNPCIQ
jgi:hypothetical protein